MPPVSVAIAGSTGSIGQQAIDVIAGQPDAFRVVAIGSGGSNIDLLCEQALAVRPAVVAVADPAAEKQLARRLDGIEIWAGPEALAATAREADVVLNAVVGFAGLPVTLAALGAGKRLALANKESLVAGGPVVQVARRTAGAELLPVDSEHAALHQCLRSGRPAEVARLVLTASGGPFRGRSASELAHVSVEDALAHPTWQMGPKITVDSSTLMNKGLEVIEANELFGTPAGDSGAGVPLDQIEVVVHPQSVVHSMVEFTDGSTIAQMSMPDMRLPIGYALGWPERLAVPYGSIDWADLRRLDFEQPDTEAFPCLALAFAAAREGGTAPAWLNAANEVAVSAFLDGAVAWTGIAQTIDAVMGQYEGTRADSVDVIVDADRRAREIARSIVQDRMSAA